MPQAVQPAAAAVQIPGRRTKERKSFMPLETSSANPLHETPSALKNEPFTQPTLLPVCCQCGLIRDDRGSSPGPERWLTPRTYQQTYDLKPDALSLTHTYCPTCFAKVRETTPQYFRQIGPPRWFCSTDPVRHRTGRVTNAARYRLRLVRPAYAAAGCWFPTTRRPWNGGTREHRWRCGVVSTAATAWISISRPTEGSARSRHVPARDARDHQQGLRAPVSRVEEEQAWLGEWIIAALLPVASGSFWGW